jgi:cell division protein FtsW (lipid II flippase)
MIESLIPNTARIAGQALNSRYSNLIMGFTSNILSLEFNMESKIEKKKKFLNTGVWLALIGVTIIICVLLILYWKYLEQFQILIYLGLFFTAILAVSPIPIPTHLVWR